MCTYVRLIPTQKLWWAEGNYSPAMKLMCDSVLKSKTYSSPSAPYLRTALMRKILTMRMTTAKSSALTFGQSLRRIFAAAGCWRSSVGCSPWSCWRSSPAGSSWTSCSSPAGERSGSRPAGTGCPRCEPPQPSPQRSLSAAAASSHASSKSSARHLKSLRWRHVADKS